MLVRWAPLQESTSGNLNHSHGVEPHQTERGKGIRRLLYVKTH